MQGFLKGTLSLTGFFFFLFSKLALKVRLNDKAANRKCAQNITVKISSKSLKKGRSG